MNEIKRCITCVLPESLPSVHLDEDGTCNHCKTYNDIYKNWEQTKSQKLQQFEEILLKAKRLNRKYDCLIPLSGGKDSTYALYLCDKVYDMKCLAVTFNNGFLSDHAKANIKNALNATKADHIFYSINRNTMLKLYNLFLKKSSSFCQPCLRGIGLVMQLAENYHIPTIISGTGARVAYLSTFPELYQNGDVQYFKNVVKGEAIERDVKEMYTEISSWNIEKIMRISRKLLRIPNPNPPHYISLYDYIDVSYDDIRSTITREIGWDKPEDKFEHMDCQVHDIAHYIHTVKFPEITSTTFHNSGLIRLGFLNRDEALEIEYKNLVNPKAPQELESFLSEIEMSKDEFEASIKNWKNIEKFRNKNTNKIRTFYYAVTKN